MCGKSGHNVTKNGVGHGGNKLQVTALPFIPETVETEEVDEIQQEQKLKNFIGIEKNAHLHVSNVIVDHGEKQS